MKAGIHPNYQPTVIKCACGATIETGSTAPASPSRSARSATPSTPASRSWSTPAAVLISSTRSTALSNLRLQSLRPRPNGCGLFLFLCYRDADLGDEFFGIADSLARYRRRPCREKQPCPARCRACVWEAPCQANHQYSAVFRPRQGGRAAAFSPRSRQAES